MFCEIIFYLLMSFAVISISLFVFTPTVLFNTIVIITYVTSVTIIIIIFVIIYFIIIHSYIPRYQFLLYAHAVSTTISLFYAFRDLFTKYINYCYITSVTLAISIIIIIFIVTVIIITSVIITSWSLRKASGSSYPPQSALRPKLASPDIEIARGLRRTHCRDRCNIKRFAYVELPVDVHYRADSGLYLKVVYDFDYKSKSK